MFQLCRRSLAAFAAACTFAIFGFTASPAQAQQKPVIKVSSLTLPVFNPLVWNIMKARGIDAKHGFELDAKAYPSISAFYAAFATGETDVLIGGPDHPAEVVSGRRAGADHRHWFHACRSRDLCKG